VSANHDTLILQRHARPLNSDHRNDFDTTTTSRHHSPLLHPQHSQPQPPPCFRQQGKRAPWLCAVCPISAPHQHYRDQETDKNTARPTAALQPFRVANAAYISSSSTKPAAPVTQSPGLVRGAPGTPPPMKAITGKPHREVPLPSQEGKQGVMQYALYVWRTRKNVEEVSEV
jgi:hypothetical protein